MGGSRGSTNLRTPGKAIGTRSPDRDGRARRRSMAIHTAKEKPPSGVIRMGKLAHPAGFEPTVFRVGVEHFIR